MADAAERRDQEFTARRDQTNIQRALDLAGAWADLDDEDGPDMLDELDRMRHASKPTPPLKL
jgi:hypothetical protein